MRFVLHTQYYPPETGAPQNRLSDLARRLVRLGHEVVVLTGMPNYPTGAVFEHYRGRLFSREQIDGVDVHRSWLFATKNQALLPRLSHYFSFVLSSFVLGMLKVGRADVVVTESPPLFLGMSGWALARLKGARFVLNVADLWPRAAVELGVVTDKSLIRLAEVLEKKLYEGADLVTGQTRGIVDHVRQRAPSTNVRLFANGVDLEVFGTRRRPRSNAGEFASDGQFVVGYGGLHGPAQCLDTLLDAADRLRSVSQIKFVFVGEGPCKTELEKTARDLDLPNVRFLPVQPYKRMPDILAEWDVALVPLMDSETMRGARPSKMIEAMGSGLPIILSAPTGEASVLVNKAGCGIHVRAEDPDELAEAIRSLFNDEEQRRRFGQNARTFVEQQFDRQRIAEEFAAHVETANLA